MTDVRRETIPLLWSAVRERASAKGVFCLFFYHGDTQYPCSCRRTKLPGRAVHREVREIGMRWVREEIVTDARGFIFLHFLKRHWTSIGALSSHSVKIQVWNLEY